MIKILRGGKRRDEITVSIDSKNWQNATTALLHCHEEQPEGYTLIAAKIVRRGSKGGRRCQLQLVLRHTNPMHRPIESSEVNALFSKELNLARGEAVSGAQL